LWIVDFEMEVFIPLRAVGVLLELGFLPLIAIDGENTIWVSLSKCVHLWNITAFN